MLGPTRISARWTVGLFAAALAVAGCAPPATDDVESANARLAGEVKAALVREADLAAAPIDVVASDGVVTLEGFVESADQIEQAQRVAAAERGVTGVVNRLRVP